MKRSYLFQHLLEKVEKGSIKNEENGFAWIRSPQIVVFEKAFRVKGLQLGGGGT